MHASPPSGSTPRSAYLAGARASLPLCVALVAFGASFGILARAAGMGRIAPIVMSMTTFGGSAQFAAASILGAGGGVAAAVVAALLLKPATASSASPSRRSCTATPRCDSSRHSL